MPFTLPALPFDPNALEPHISAKTFSFHHGKHHQTYVTNLNGLVKDSPLDSQSLEAVIAATAADETKAGIFNNAAQVWNHTFFWNSLSPERTEPSSALAKRIETAFGSLDAFKDQFKQVGLSQFGSGWAWLVADAEDNLRIIKTPNASTPLTLGLRPLLTCDVWEHAYYLDYQNRRADFLQVFLDHLVNWTFADANAA